MTDFSNFKPQFQFPGNFEFIGDNESDQDQSNIISFKIFTDNILNQDDHSSIALKARLWHHLNGKYFWNYEIPKINFKELEGNFEIKFDLSDEYVFLNQLLSYSKDIDKNAVIHVQDTEGDFILIECAELLPEWLDPDIAENRCFLHQGNLHIIPEDEGMISSLDQGKDIIKDPNVETVASDEIQEMIQKSIQERVVDKQRQVSRAVVPLKIAKLLKADPRLMAFASSEFSDLEAAPSISDKFVDMSSKELVDAVEINPEMSRCMFAQFVLQESIEIIIPAFENKIEKKSENDIEVQSWDVGMKITIAFDVLYNNNPTITHWSSLKFDKLYKEVDFEQDESYLSFVDSLKDINYLFEESDEQERRKLYIIMKHKLYEDTMSVAQYIDELLENDTSNLDEFKNNLPVLAENDSIDWIKETIVQYDENEGELDEQSMAQLLGGMNPFLGNSEMEINPDMLQKMFQALNLGGEFEGEDEDEYDEEEGDEEEFNQYSQFNSGARFQFLDEDDDDDEFNFNFKKNNKDAL